ncbi:hypothetical protein KO566_13620 [Flavobacteriaceae bacterium XHP0103]|uniref:hypothetical protein n=1 Tax=Marixanthotalea marina TaxID=2844359 RepID=UPI002989E9F7|nr:hypothetical protein [Marixanthotalea marina]MBU3823096.1 hypothetical protein [Marixanthotalea marina]
MKTFKTPILVIILVCFSFNFSLAQQMYRVHVDYVKPSKLMEYENIAKDFLEASKKYNLQTSWITTTTSDHRYMYVNPIENFAELDKNPFGDMSSQMGSSFQDLFKRFNACYDEHGDYILVLDETLSYMPTGMTPNT